MSEEECQKQCSDMRTVDIGIRHNNDFTVFQIIDIEIIADTCTECLYNRQQLFVLVNLVNS